MNHPRRRNLFTAATKNALLSIAAIVFSLFAIEAGARLYYSGVGAPHWTNYDFRLTQPAPYRDAAYFSRAFIRESFEQPDSYFVVAGTRILLPAEYVGRWFNVSGSRRITTDVPKAATRRVIIFGGSAVYGSEVPDDMTFASFLQRELNRAEPGTYAVLNYGVTAVGASQQLERMRTVPIKANDIIIFFDGANDLYNGILFGRPDGWFVGENQNVLATLPRWHAALLRASLWLSVYVDMARPFAVQAKRAIPSSVADPDLLAANVRRTAEHFRDIEREAAGLVHAQGARFVHFVQPNLFAREHLSDYEASLLEMPLVVVPGTEVVFRKGFPALRAVSGELRSDGIESHDLSAVLVERPAPDIEYFLDAMHVTHAGNAVVARHIADALLKRSD